MTGAASDNQDFVLQPPGEKEAAAPVGLCTRRELAARLDVHMQTITKWEREANFPIDHIGGPGRPSYYHEAKVREWLSKRGAIADAASADRFDANRARAQKDFWQAQLAEQQHQLRAGVLVHVEDVERAWTAELTALRAAILNSVPSSAERLHRASTLQGIDGVEAELKAISLELLRELSDPDRPVADLPDRSPAPRLESRATPAEDDDEGDVREEPSS